jgi:hypothetical protein
VEVLGEDCTQVHAAHLFGRVRLWRSRSRFSPNEIYLRVLGREQSNRRSAAPPSRPHRAPPDSGCATRERCIMEATCSPLVVGSSRLYPFDSDDVSEASSNITGRAAARGVESSVHTSGAPSIPAAVPPTQSGCARELCTAKGTEYGYCTLYSEFE